jgi:hypothetical protein
MADARTSRGTHARGLAALLAFAFALALALTDGAATQPAAPESAPAASDSAPAASAPASAAGADEAIELAVKALRTDPLLSGTHKVHRLEFKNDKTKEKKRPRDNSSFQWLRDLFAFLNDTSRLLVYGLALVLVTLLIVTARRFMELRDADRRIRSAGAAVSHVRDLDVRPESLPDDIGAAAWSLWQAGNVAAALSLLYRGALSRLIHRHDVPIAASTTEGECLDLARGRIAPPAHRYLTQLVLAWEAVTYGERTLSVAMGEVLCSGFASRLDAAAAAAPAPQGGNA